MQNRNQPQVVVKNVVGPSFITLLTILFITLKLTGVITWSWWWVLAPLWIPFAIAAAFFFVALVIAGLIALFGK